MILLTSIKSPNKAKLRRQPANTSNLEKMKQIKRINREPLRSMKCLVRTAIWKRTGQSWFNLVTILVSLIRIVLWDVTVVFLVEDDEDFRESLFKTLQTISEKAETITGVDGSVPEDELAKMFANLAEMENANKSGESAELNNVMPLMSNIMQNLLSKEFLYPTLSDLNSKVLFCDCNPLTNILSHFLVWVVLDRTQSSLIGKWLHSLHQTVCLDTENLFGIR